MKLIFITGKQGAGKSYVAGVFAESKEAHRLDVDRVLKSGAEGWPRANGQSPFDWKLWEEKAKSSDLRPVLRHAIEQTYGSLVRTRGNLIVEGAILCNLWFFEPFREALVDALELEAIYDASYVYVNPSIDLLRANVVHRAEREPSRCKELETFSSEDAVRDYHRGFERAIAGDSKWREYPTKEAAPDAVRRILAICCE